VTNSSTPTGNRLLTEEQLSAGDEAFIDSIRALHEPKALASLADKWKHDPRPWARSAMVRYVLLPFDQEGHEVVVKRLFKQAEARGDDAVMAAFLVAFDRLVRRRRGNAMYRDPQTRRWVNGEILTTPRNVIPNKALNARSPRTGEPMSYRPHVTPRHRLFRYRTRYYLQRRVWRYFRKLGFKDGPRYLSALRTALTPFTDADLSAGEHLIDSWSLMHALHGESTAVEFSALRATLKEGCTLADLKPAPAFSKHWRTPAGANTALSVLIEAQSRLVRTWALAWHRELTKTIAAVPSTDELMRMLAHADEDVQSYGASLIVDSPDAANWTLDTWLRLLKSDNPRIAQLLCDAMLKHVSTDRLNLAQAAELAKAKAVPIARMGLQFLQQRKPQSADDRAVIAELSRAESLGVGQEIALWALGYLGQPEGYETKVVCRFFDSANASVRLGAWTWLSAVGSAGWPDATLWSRLTETPYDDLRMRMIDALTMRATAPQLAPTDLAPVWTTVLLNVHRGGRQKLRAVRQIADAIAQQPEASERLLPVMVTAVRSIRGPEARAALSAVLSVLDRHPSLEEDIVIALPELNLNPNLEAAA